MIFLFDGDQFDWMHALEVLFGGIGALGVFAIAAYGWHREDKRDREEKLELTKRELLSAAEKVEEKNEERHKENQDVIAQLLHDVGSMTTKVEAYPLHIHTENEGPLTVDGMWPKFKR